MNDKDIEEKAKQRANDNWRLPDEVKLTLEIETLKRYTADDYTTGYTQAITDQSDTLSQYKEVLRELVELAPVVIDPCVAETYFEALECRRKYILASEKAKQLFNNE
ncbi:hypothetical protein [Dysgonomonas sp. BGC7]|uniref:hypothetical protein n=1 Tax=Dysgonomonas sp. BGC7 TaxID=1658008 RepID=UPI0006810723|nr:hypothetical protein [Dysgonomonas sp. BGC7]MBD8389644.1 hypothetical protein [Dysgonomonas sp. BGC7]